MTRTGISRHIECGAPTRSSEPVRALLMQSLVGRGWGLVCLAQVKTHSWTAAPAGLLLLPHKDAPSTPDGTPQSARQCSSPACPSTSPALYSHTCHTWFSSFRVIRPSRPELLLTRNSLPSYPRIIADSRDRFASYPPEMPGKTGHNPIHRPLIDSYLAGPPIC